jgi:hypothetical protein
VAEWLKAHAWNACIGETLSRVRIPLSPPLEWRTELSSLPDNVAVELGEVAPARASLFVFSLDLAMASRKSLELPV